MFWGFFCQNAVQDKKKKKLFESLNVDLLQISVEQCIILNAKELSEVKNGENYDYFAIRTCKITYKVSPPYNFFF